MSKRHQLTAAQWRIISYLYHPDQLARRTAPSLAVVIDKQAVDRGDVVEVVERGLVQARVGGEECAHALLKKLPDRAIRLRLSKSGTYHAGTDPQHAVMSALRSTTPGQFTLWDLMYRLEHVPHCPKPAPGMIPPRITFGELAEMAERFLFDTFLVDDDIPVTIREVQTIPGLAYAKQTKTGASYVAYL
ncbi:hypothetical protein [Actinoplanes sp. TFC3]|uniref:hypothetical protein n=1 Tax=Actinoplanes sp. TFC3 TaxID=1710355 RepID=UPI000829FEEB|nr:hypothetical protein [Actinoplanes sp. TFC3]